MTSEKKKGYSINTTDYIGKMVNHCRKHGLAINLKNPITIQDKLAWLNIYDVNPLKVLCADKIKVHDYCKEKLGKDICIPIIKVYDSVDEIDLNELPNSFVLKCNHGSGMNIIVKDKNEFDFEDAKKKLALWMDDDFAFRNGFEAHYHDIERKIFAEEYKEDSSNGLIDYKFICFNGKPTFIQIIYDRFGPERHMNYYDANFNYVNLARRDFRTDPLFDHKKPERLELMLSYAETLSSDFPFVRIDFYEVNGEVFLGEMTFTPGAMGFRYVRDNDNLRIGKLLDISKVEKFVAPTVTQKKTLIYTVLLGLYEAPTCGFKHKDGYEYRLLTDKPVKVASWDCFKVSFNEVEGLTDIKKARYVKTHPHKFFEDDYEAVVFIDANTPIDDKLYDYIEKNKNNPITFKYHHSRICTYDEIMACYYSKKDTADKLLELYDMYSLDGYPRDNGLYETNVIIMHHKDPKVIELMDKWWNFIFVYSHRDQLSINYVIWKYHFSYFVHAVKTYDFIPIPHKKLKNVEDEKESTSS